MKHRKPTEFISIQVTRFVAAAVVLATHITLYLHERVDPTVSVLHVGEAGVPLFFVVSGFVMIVSSRSLERNAQGARTFLMRRFERILPMYWIATTIKVAAALAVPAVVLHNHFEPGRAIASYLLWPTYNDAGEIRPLHGVGWTLLHEMYFYYLFSLALLMRLSPLKTVAAIIVVGWLLGAWLQPGSAVLRVMSADINLYFAAGMMLGQAVLSGWSLRPRWSGVLLVAGVVIAFSGWFDAAIHRVFSSFSPGPVMIVVAVVYLDAFVAAHVPRVLAKLGDSSYSLYLFHPFAAPALCVGLMKAGIGSAGLIFAVTWLGVIALAHAIYWTTERPITKRLRSYGARVAAARPAAGA